MSKKIEPSEYSYTIYTRPASTFNGQKILIDEFNKYLEFTNKNCSLIELLEQRDEMIEALKTSNEVLSEFIKLKGGRNFGKTYMNDQWIKNKKLLTKIQNT